MRLDRVSRSLLLAIAVLAAASPLPAAEADLSASIQGFGFDLHRRLASERKSVVFSPYSLWLAFVTVRAGARGETAKELDAALHLPAGGLVDAHRALSESLRASMEKGVRAYERERRRFQDEEEDRFVERDQPLLPPVYQVLNRFFVQTGLPLQERFLRRLTVHYDTPVLRLDFSDPSSASARINAWLERETRGQLRGAVSPSSFAAETRLALITAVTFRGSWHTLFDEDVRELPFHGVDGETYEVPTMMLEEELPYAEDARLQVLELPYKGKEFSMLLLLPRRWDGLPELERRLSPELLSSYVSRLQRRQVVVRMPEFQVRNDLDARRALQSLGVRRLFVRGKAQLGDLSPVPELCVNGVAHSARIAVDRRGTVAEAVTAVGLEFGVEPPPPVYFIADHPFVFVLRHPKTGCVLFLGRFGAPERAPVGRRATPAAKSDDAGGEGE